MERISKEEFIRRAKLRHCDKYDYSKVFYVNSKTKVCVICPVHGEFNILPSMHIFGRGCSLCGHTKPLSLTNDEFIRKATNIHNGLYTYENTNFIGIRKKVTITCPIHGDFEQIAQSHLKGHGCKLCADLNQKKSTKQFIIEAKKIHGNKYSYEKTKYTDCRDKVCITCKIHGDFWQMANAHLQGEGCPNCNKSFGELKVKCFLDTNNIDYVQQHKIKNNNLFCSNKYLCVDFFLETYNVIIEYNGIQHYKQTDYFHHKNLEKQQERDMALRQYCKEHKIKLIEIPYTEYDNIETILEKELNINKIKTKKAL